MARSRSFLLGLKQIASRKVKNSVVSCRGRLVIRPWAACKCCGEASRGNPSSSLLVRVEQRTAGVHAGVPAAPWPACLPADTAAALQGGVWASPLSRRSCASCSLSARRTDTFRTWRRGFHFLQTFRGWSQASVFQSTASCASPCVAPRATCVGSTSTEPQNP